MATIEGLSLWLEVGKWLLASISLLGVVLNIKRQRACFYIWAFTNATWTIVDLSHGIYAQAALQAVYVVLAIWGIVAWKNKEQQ